MSTMRFVSRVGLGLLLGLSQVCAAEADVAAAPSFQSAVGSWFEASPAESVTTESQDALVSEDAQPIDLNGSLQPELRDGANYFDTGLLNRNGRLLGIIAPSDRDFYCFVSPQSNVLFFEDPRTLTEVRTHFVNQTIPGSNPVFNGGSAQYVAAQVRVALTKRLSIIANKDGYLWLHPTNPAVGDPQGSADLAAGLKYNLIRNPQRQFVLSSGFSYGMPTGAQRVFQGNGNGEWNLFLTGGKEFFGCAHLVSGTGLRLPNSGVQSKMWYWSTSADVMLTRRIYALTQLNWFHWFESGTALPVNFEGNDLMNLGSTNVAGNNIVTASWGGRYKFGRYHEAGVAYEVPLTERKDLLQSRLYCDLILRY